MNTQLLRQKVLDLAIHGKLLDKAVVEALETTPGYEPASKLLERIRGESLPLATAGKPSSAAPSAGSNAARNACSNPISEDEKPFEIPENWCWCRLPDISKNIIAGGDKPDIFSKEKSGECFVPIYSNGIENNGLYGYTNEARILEPSITVSARGTIGFSCIRMEPFLPIVRLISITPECLIEIKYIKYVLDTLLIQGEGSSIPQLTVPSIKQFLFPLPPLEEQKLIVEEIERIFALIDTVEQNKVDLETVIKQTKSKILDLAIHGKLVPQDKADEPASKLVDRIKKEREKLIKNKIIKEESFFSAIEEKDPLPNNWTYVKIGDLTSVVTKQTGFDYSSTIKPNLSREKLDGMIPMVQTKNFSGKKFDLNTDYYIQKEIAQQFPKILLDSKCLLLSIVGASIGNIGVYSKTDLAMIGGAICKVKLLNEDLYDYLYYYLKSPTGQNLISKKIKSTAQGTITVQNVRELTIPLPPLNEQKRIVAKIEEIFTYLDSITKSIG